MAALVRLYTPLPRSYAASAEGGSYECLFMAMYPFRTNPQVPYPESQNESVKQCLGMWIFTKHRGKIDTISILTLFDLLKTEKVTNNILFHMTWSKLNMSELEEMWVEK